MVHFGVRLQHAMDTRPASYGGPVSVSELASECKVSFQAVRKWQKSATPKLASDSAIAAARICCVDLNWLLTGTGSARPGVTTGEPIPQWASVPQDLSAYLLSLDDVARDMAATALNRLASAPSDQKLKDQVVAALSSLSADKSHNGKLPEQASILGASEPKVARK